MNDVTIRFGSAGDVAFCAQLDVDEGWTDTPQDMRRLVLCEPRGFLIAEVCGRPVGQILSISYGNMGWVGLLIVSSHYRGKGIGTVLMRRGIAYLQQSHVETVYLEAIPHAANFYRKLGFNDILRTWKFGRLNDDIPLTDASKVERMQNIDLTDVGELDKLYFLGNRLRVLEGIFRDNPNHCFVAKRRGGIKGYVMCRPTRLGFRIGPLICDPSVHDIAESLLVAAMNSLPEKTMISLSAPEPNQICLDLLSRYQFERLTSNVRMFFGKRPDPSGTVGVFALAGLEKG